MINQKTMDRLLKNDDVENAQLHYHCFIQDLPDAVLKGEFQKDNVEIKNSYFFQNRDVYISKHHRYSAYPIHSHSFLEMNYVVSGEADEIVWLPGSHHAKKLHLNRGDLLLINQGTRHAVNYLNTNDIMVNILFQDLSISLKSLEQMRGSQSVLYQFFLDHHFQRDSQYLGYMIFRYAEAKEISRTIDLMINEYFNSRLYSNLLIRSLMDILIVQLVRNFNFQKPVIKNKKQQIMMNILDDIDKNYQKISLKAEAQKYSYNPSYLSQLIYRETGDKFSHILLKQRLTKANELLKTTKLPVVEIMKKVGVHNRNYFNQKYRQAYHRLPAQDRN